jgi:hypothetical protein
LLGLVKLWEAFWKDRIQLRSTHNFSTQEGWVDTITVVNLSSVPIQVSHWELAWKPRHFRWRTSTIDVTPREGLSSMFTIGARDSHTIWFEADSKFDWGYPIASRRALFLTLHIFGRRCPKALKITA